MCNWVQDNYARPLTRESVAQFFNITPNHLSKLFTQHGTMSFVEYVRWVRMAKARIILQKYHLSISEVAERCGYHDSDYFLPPVSPAVWPDAGRVQRAFSGVTAGWRRKRLIRPTRKTDNRGVTAGCGVHVKRIIGVHVGPVSEAPPGIHSDTQIQNVSSASSSARRLSAS
ncbi:AraC family transcriptional regulator [Citrobacter koseri]|nr:AraC family transcriptional regulator [Citrobacter koseri]